jgi:ABC-2 type transport system permease protein
MSGELNAIWAIAKREMDGYYATATGWFTLLSFVGITGFFFVLTLIDYQNYVLQASFSPYGEEQMGVDEALIPGIFANWSVVLLLIAPAISMRIFSEDLRQRTFELLLSSPVSSGAIVMGKFLGAMGFVGSLFLATAYQPAVLYWVSAPDPGVLAGSYVAMYLLAACCIGLGMLLSAFTTAQIVAFITSFAALLLLYLLGWVGELKSGGPISWVGELSMLSHLDQIGKGLLHTEDLVYFVSFIGLCLFATQQRVESFRWR